MDEMCTPGARRAHQYGRQLSHAEVALHMLTGKGSSAAHRALKDSY